MMIRSVKIVMCLCLSAFALLCAADNMLDYGANFAFVRHVLTMDTTFQDPAMIGRAVTAPLLWHGFYWLIIAGEAVTGFCFALGAFAMWHARRSSPVHFHQAKHWAYAGSLAAFLIWFLGFMVVGGEWFQMWQSHIWNGQEAAFRFCLIILAVLIFLNQPEAE